jgi:hypothetical protein
MFIAKHHAAALALVLAVCSASIARLYGTTEYGGANGYGQVYRLRK